jgi:hypothetical protein
VWEEKRGEEPNVSASLLPCTSSDTYHLSKYPSLSIVVKYLASIFSCCYSFEGSSSVLIADALIEGP